MLFDSLATNNGASASLGETLRGYPMQEEKLGRDDFMTLLITQLKNQDPLNPLESDEFAAQLAQFSSLEQLFNVNENLEVMRVNQDQNARLQALGFLGKEVIAEGDTFSLEEGGIQKGRFISREGGQCTVTIRDSNGNPVRRLLLGSLQAGTHTFQWDGRNESGDWSDPGIYTFEISIVTGDGRMLDAETQISGRVTSVNMEGDSPLLYVGDVPIALSQVLDIRIPGSTGSEPAQEGQDE